MKRFPILLGVIFVLLGMLLLAPADTCLAVENSQSSLSLSYFLPPTGKNLIYSGYDNNTYQYSYVSKWQMDEKSVYQETRTYKDQSISYTHYIEASNALCELDSGFAIPQSECSQETITSGEKIVLQVVTPDSTWDNQYQTTDSYGNICDYNSRYRYWGMETLHVLGKPMPAAKVTWYEQCKVVKEVPEAEWTTVPHTATGTNWYVEGYGLVKSESQSWHSPHDVYRSTVTLAKVQ